MFNCKIQGYINTKDLGWIDRNGFLHVVGREDDVIKVYGYRLTTTEIEGVSYYYSTCNSY